jgi:recombinational DNA repair protein RecR
MSNHDGSYMLNDVLKLLEKESIFEIIGQEKSQKIALDFIKIGNGHDCNNGEILDDIGERLKICYCCLKISNEFKNGLCKSCYGND